MFLPTGDSGLQQMTRITSQSCSNPYSSRSYEASYDLVMSLEEQGDDDSSRPSTCESDDSEVGIIENPSDREDLGQPQEENTFTEIEDLKLVNEGLVSSSCQFLNASIVEDPQANDTMGSGDENGGSRHSWSEIHDMPIHQDSDDAEKRMDCGDAQMIGDDFVPDSPEQPAFKKPRFMHTEGEINETESNKGEINETESINEN